METKELQTTDLQLITFLVFSGFSPSKPPHLEGSLTYFSFERSPDLTEAISKFLNREATGEVLAILEAARKVKSMVWSTRKPRGSRGGDHNGN